MASPGAGDPLGRWRVVVLVFAFALVSHGVPDLGYLGSAGSIAHWRILVPSGSKIGRGWILA